MNTWIALGTVFFFVFFFATFILAILMAVLPSQAIRSARSPQIILAISWAGFLIYEYVFINCPRVSCNIRPDLLLVYPYLLITTVCCVIGIVKKLDESKQDT
jgi:hypothetical protein